LYLQALEQVDSPNVVEIMKNKPDAKSKSRARRETHQESPGSDSALGSE